MSALQVAMRHRKWPSVFGSAFCMRIRRVWPSACLKHTRSCSAQRHFPATLCSVVVMEMEKTGVTEDLVTFLKETDPSRDEQFIQGVCEILDENEITEVRGS